jgi:hypothetical protein
MVTMSFTSRKVLNPLKRWINDYLSMYVLFGLLIINLSLYYLYYSLESIFINQLIVFLFKITGEKLFPFFGFYLSILPPFIASYMIHLESRISRPIIKIIMIFITIILALALTLTFIPLSITIFVAYISLAGVVSCISFLRFTLEELKLPSISDNENRRSMLEMRHNLLITILAYSIWAIITIVAAGLSALLFNPAVGEMVKLGGLRWVFVEGVSILCISLMAYYSLGIITGAIINIFKKILEVEEVLKE